MGVSVCGNEYTKVDVTFVDGTAPGDNGLLLLLSMLSWLSLQEKEGEGYLKAPEGPDGD